MAGISDAEQAKRVAAREAIFDRIVELSVDSMPAQLQELADAYRATATG